MREEPLCNGLVLAAGRSTRMGAFKMLMPLDGETVIERSISSMFRAGVSSVVLVVGYRGDEIERTIGNRFGDRLTTVYNHDYAHTDMLHSIRLGLRSLPPCDAFFLLPGDMPGIGKETFLAVRKRWAESGCTIAFPTVGGRRKHPPLVSSSCIDRIGRFHGEGGLRTIWREYADVIATVAVEDEGCESDLDTMEDYRRFLGRQSHGHVAKDESKQEVSGYGYQ